MKVIDSNTIIIDSYFELLKNLSLSSKTDLISRLSQSAKAVNTIRLTQFEKAFGGWEGTETAEELAESIKSSRKFNRQIEQL